MEADGRMRRYLTPGRHGQWLALLLAAVLTAAVSTAFAAGSERLAKGDRFILVGKSLDMVDNRWVQVINEFKVISSEGNKIRFSVKTYGGNLHSCALKGDATWRGSYYEFIETGVGEEPCMLRIHSSGDQVRLEDKGLKCRFACGARAGLDGFVLKREDVSNK